MSQIKVPQMSVLGFVLNYMVKTNPELSKGIVYAFIYMESLEVPRRWWGGSRSGEWRVASSDDIIVNQPTCVSV